MDSGFQRQLCSSKALANLAGTPVWDWTGLTEFYDFKLDLTTRVAPPTDTANAGPHVIDRCGRVSDAVEEQLGLRVESRKGPADVITIQHAEHPSAN